jgi:1-pyrroline-5-carboxylate dehydrogenase
MSKGFFKLPNFNCEKVKSYKSDSNELNDVIQEYKRMWNKKKEIPMIIGGSEVHTEKKNNIVVPHNHKHTIGSYSIANENHVKDAIKSALDAKKNWEELSWENRASIFLRAADLLSGPFRSKMNASTMISQSKSFHQAEIDAACEMIDFFRFNVKFMTEIYHDQPESTEKIWNRLEYRPLEGFIYAITPFNFTSIAANLCVAPALMGNTIVWKPSENQIYSSNIIMDLLKESGLPDGVINIIYGDPNEITNEILSSKYFSGLHFTGSTNVFKDLWKKIGNNINKYINYPRIVGETGGKDFIIAHSSANVNQVVAGIIRGAFEYQGQKCSAASRAYISSNLWNEVKDKLISELNSIKIGDPIDPKNFMNAVISEKSFDKIIKYITNAKKDKDVEIIFGGNYSKKLGFFIEPTVIVSKDPKYATMTEELFGPVITIYVYEELNFDSILSLIDETSIYALTGAIFSNDRYSIELALQKLKNSAGNFYINDKPTGAVVSQQPFGGSRSSGTNDKAGSKLNLLRWVSPRTIKENFLPESDFRYPFME